MLLLLAAVSLPASEALAGDGKIKNLNGQTGDPLGVELYFAVTFPPTASDVDAAKSQLERASKMICDASEGGVRITKVTFVPGGSYNEEADIFWVLNDFAPKSGATPGTPFGTRGNFMRLVGGLVDTGTGELIDGNDGIHALTIAHEFGHLFFGLADSYFEQRSNGEACGYGMGLDTPLSETNATMMTGTGHKQKCLKPFTLDATRFYCYTNFDCQNTLGLANHVCASETYPKFTEYSTAPNYEQVLGDNSPGSFPGPRQGEDVWLTGWFHALQGTDPNVTYNPSLSPQENGETHAHAFTRLEFLDDLGVLEDGWGSQSSHYLYFYFVHETTDTWSLRVGIDEGETGGTAGETRFLKFDHGGGNLLDELILTFDMLSPLNAQPEFDMLSECFELAQIDGDPDLSSSPKLKIANLERGDGASAANFFLDTKFTDSAGNIDFWNHLYVCNPPGVEPNIYGTSYSQTSGQWRGSRIVTNSNEQQLGDCGVDENDTPAMNDRWDGATQIFQASQNYVRTMSKTVPSESFPWMPEWDGQAVANGNDWSLLRYLIKMRYDVMGTPFVVNPKYSLDAFGPPDDPIAPTNTVECADADVIDFDESRLVEDTEAVYVLLDVSSSMNQELEISGVPATRLDWAKAGIASFASYAEGAGYEAGLGVFARNFVPKVLVSPVTSLLPTIAEMQEVTILNCDEWNINPLNPCLDTAFHPALWGAVEQIEAQAPEKKKSILLITDSEQEDVEWIWWPTDACDPEAPRVPWAPTACFPRKLDYIAWQIEKEHDIQVSVVNISDHPNASLAGLAEATDGEFFEASEAAQVVPAFMKAHAALLGQSIALDETRMDVAYALPGYPTSAEASVYVEGAAERLVFTITNVGSVENWDLGVVVDGPQGEHYTNTHPEVIEDPHDRHKTVLIPTPSEGMWTITLASSGGTKTIPEEQLVAATIDHEGPGCVASVDRVIVTEEDPLVKFTAAASNDFTTILSGVTYTVEVEAPNGTVTQLELDQNPHEEVALASYEVQGGRGNYKATVRCEVSDEARYEPGDEFDPAESGDLPRPPAFVRERSFSFFADFEDTLLPPGDDCDEDGHLNSAEGDPRTDTDGDGTPDVCDDDSDGDELLDVAEAPGDFDGDGVENRLDVDSDGDGDMDGMDAGPTDADSRHKYAAGDLNGDGMFDRVIGLPANAGSAKGKIRVEYGAAYSNEVVVEFWDRDKTDVADFAEEGDEFGASVVVRDFNDDGIDDVAVGVPGDKVGTIVAAGSVHVFYGSASGLSTNGDQVWHQNSSGVLGECETGDRFGTRLTVGDFDGDGAADLAIGSPNEGIGTDANAGAVSVLYGGVGGVSSVDDLWYQGSGGVNGSAEGGDRFGDALAAGDFDDDSFVDLVIGAPYEDGYNMVDTGYVYAIYGSSSGLVTAGDFGFFQTDSGWAGTSEAGDRLGTRFWIEDRDEDGFADLTVFVPGDGCGAGTNGYQVVYGDPGGLSASGNALECLLAYQEHA